MWGTVSWHAACDSHHNPERKPEMSIRNITVHLFVRDGVEAGAWYERVLNVRTSDNRGLQWVGVSAGESGSFRVLP